jgi:hypothetical protein
MSNRFLFRGKRVDNGEWIYGFILGSIDPCQKETAYRSWWIHNGVSISEMVEVNPETVGQWTGREDDKKARIFGGDKVIFAYGASKVLKHPNMIRIGTVVFENYQWSVKIDNSEVRTPFSIIDGIEVIGNIHES